MQNLNRRRLLQLGVAYGLSAMSSRLLAAGGTADFYRRSMIIDGMGFPGSPTSQDGAPLSAAELGDVRTSGLTACHVTIGSVGTMPPLEAFENVIRSADHWGHEIESNADVFQSVRTVSDIQAAKDAGRTGLIFGLQDGVSFEDDPTRLSALHRAGVRIIQPTYNRRNLLGDGCMEPADAGLSRAGVDAIRQMCELGISVDLSHCGRKTAADAMAAATRPVSFTHTGCHALAEHPRHRTDAEIRAAADSGGVIGIFIMPYLSKGAQPTAADVVRHIEHALQVAGEDHVSIGTDGNVSPTVLTDEFKKTFRESTAERKRLGIAAPFETEEGYLFANDLNTSRRFETLAELLLDRGHSEARVAKILGANLVRVFSETWNS
jgi:membrane dipeptidase